MIRRVQNPPTGKVGLRQGFRGNPRGSNPLLTSYTHYFYMRIFKFYNLQPCTDFHFVRVGKGTRFVKALLHWE